MAITTTERTKITQLAVSMFAAAPGAYLAELADTYTAAGKSMTALANGLASLDAFKVNFPSYLSNAEIATKMANQYGMTDLTSGIGKEALDYFTAELTAGKTIGSLYVVANEFISTTTLSNWATPKALFNNQVKLAEYYTVDMNGSTKDLNTLKAILANVTSTTDTGSATAMEAFIDATAGGLTIPGTTLTTKQDILTGTSGNDSFKAYVIDNANTFQSGDIINGGAGTDKLTIELGSSQAFAITAKTQSVENIFIRNQSVDADDLSDNGTNNSINGTDGSEIDAQDMVGVKQYWSVDSRADLQIEDVRQNSHETTIGFRNADAGDVDYEVYFDHATAIDATTAGATLYLRILDLQSMELNGTPLTTNPYNGVSFKVAGVTVTAKAPAAFTGTFAQMVTELNASLASQGYTTLSVALGSTYSAIKADTGVAYSGTELVITNSGSGALTTGGWTTPDGSLPATNNVYTTQSTTPPSSTTPLTSVLVELDNVGRGSQSGDFVIGLITDNNESTGAQKSGEGIQQFNVTVDRNSWIDSLATTENVLQEVNVVNKGANGTVRIDSLVDVKTFNASTMTGAVNLTATLSEAVVTKYMELGDVAAPSADLDAFNYTMGTGNDTLNLTIDNANLAAAGTTTREDFSLNITAGTGNDNVTTLIETGIAAGTEAWYLNSKINANLAINTNEGNDTINNNGGGDFKINAGAGDDTVYVDNSGQQNLTVATVINVGDRGTFVFNTADQAAAAGAGVRILGDLISDGNDTMQMYKATATVTFKGIQSSAITIASTNYVTSDLQINQAIKDAINNNAVLNKLLIAQDGPSNTLVVTSLIDGTMVLPAELSVAVAVPAASAITAADVTAINAAYLATNTAHVAYADAAAVVAAFAVNLAASTTAVDYLTAFAADDAGSAITGTDSTNVNDSTITDSTGNDVYVLSTDVTGGTANTTSNNTVVFNTVGFGNDTIVNFTVAALTAGGDTLNFRAFMDNTLVGTAPVATTLTNNKVGVATADVTIAGPVITQNLITIDGLFNDNLATSAAGENHNATEVKNLYMANNGDSADATGSITTLYISVNSTDVGTVYQVVDATTAALEATDITVTLLGTIDLSDTGWSTMALANLA